MEDLGDAPNLADLLLGGDEKRARAALIEWARTYGRLAVQTAGRESELGQASGTWVTEDMAKLSDFLRVLGIAAPPGLDADLDAVSALDHDRFRVFSPGDICPDNHLLTPEGLRPIDFEGAGFHMVEDEDRPMNRTRISDSSMRQVLCYRWEVTATALERARELPATAAVLRGLLAETEDWRSPDLPAYPAFRR